VPLRREREEELLAAVTLHARSIAQSSALDTPVTARGLSSARLLRPSFRPRCGSVRWTLAASCTRWESCQSSA
jgi:hypothetical protein